jgi:hypothetical protein
VSGLDDLNNDIATGGGGYANLKTKGNVIEGVFVDGSVRDKYHDGKVVRSQAGNIRKEWVLALDTPEGPTKVTANEDLQMTIKRALRDAGKEKLEPGCKLRIEVLKSTVQGKLVTERFAVTYTPPKMGSLPVETDEPPF